LNISLVWDNVNARGDWQIAGSSGPGRRGRMATGHLLTSVVLIMLFTDRVAQPDYVPNDGSGDRRGWWHDSFDGTPIGSRLWQLRRRKIANRPALIAEATDMANEALQPLLDDGIASAIQVVVTSPTAGNGNSGTLLNFAVTIFQPTAPASLINALWNIP
jgi:phage gp46-like protein